MKNFRSRGQEFFLTLPSFFWLSLFFLIPTALVFILAFRPADPFGGIGRGWTTATIKGLADPQYLAIAWRTLWVSFLSTAFCLLLAVPTALLPPAIIPWWWSAPACPSAWR